MPAPVETFQKRMSEPMIEQVTVEYPEWFYERDDYEAGYRE